jgi:hypothetical protein
VFSGKLAIKHALSFNKTQKKRTGITEIRNTDRLCLPRALAVGLAHIQFFKEKTITEHRYRLICGLRSAQSDTQAQEARALCCRADINAEEYTFGIKTFGMDEVQAFAATLSPKYGVAIHNSLTANSKVFESPRSS